MPSVVVVGGGLAGLVSARQLAQRGFGVKILESTDRAGGKAGAEQVAGEWREHGYHIFPAWYDNVRTILDELGVRLIDFDRWHYLLPGQPDKPLTLRVPDGIASAWQSLRSGLLPWQHTVLYFYFVLDMLSEPLSNKALLDQVSRVGLMRGRWYMTDRLPELEQENVLKASAIPVYDMSAMTAKLISAYWVRRPLPFLSILPGDLQRTFIEPLAGTVRAAGVDIQLNQRVQNLAVHNGRVQSVSTVNPAGVVTVHAADSFVITTPLEVTRRLIGADLQRLDPELGDIEHLQAAPMAALHLTLNRVVHGLPKEHVFLHGGRHGLSFIDLTSHWPGMTKTRLSFISSNFVPLRDLTPAEQYAALFEEVVRYLPISAADVESYDLRPNTDTPLFINTIAAWPNRPGVQASQVDNLFFAGDWVRNVIDLACMEGAVASAHEAARAVGLRHGVADIPGAKKPRSFDPRLLRVLKWALAPAMAPVWLYAKLTGGSGEDDPLAS